MIDVYAPAGAFRDRAVKERIWVPLTEAPDGGWGLAGHAHTNAELARQELNSARRNAS